MISVLLALIFFSQCILIFTLMEVKEEMVNNGINLEVICNELRYEEVSDVLSSYEIERQEADKLFDERIRQMAAEINFGAEHISNHIPTESEVLEDGLYNIPHNEVNIYNLEEEEFSL